MLPTFRFKKIALIIRTKRSEFRFFVFFVLFFALQFPCIIFSGNIDLPKDASGWTIFKPSDDSRIMYVAAGGNDTTATFYDDDDSVVGADPFNPTGPINAFATYAAAKSQSRQGYPDWILLKRGDTFTVTGEYPIVPYEGRSNTEPSLLGSYGSSGVSPIVKIGTDVVQAIRIMGLASNSNITISGIDFYSYTRNPSDAGYVGASGTQTGLFVYNFEGGLLIEGCKFRFFDDSILNNASTIPADGLVLRRNIFTDNYAGPGQSHSQGLLITAQNATLEENIFIHNGWYSVAGGTPGEATIFNHNVYNSGPKGATYIRNIFIQGSNMNNKFTADPAGSNQYPITIENNLYIDGQQGIGFGNNTAGNTYPFLNVTIKDNVFTNIGKLDHLQSIAWGIDVGYDSTGTAITNNLLINQTNSDVTGDIPFIIAGIQTSLSITRNIVYNWKFADTFRVMATGAQNSTGATKTNVSFTNNTISNPTNAGYFVKADTTVSGLSFDGNRYYGDKAESALFRIGSIDYSLSGWQTANRDNSIFDQIIFSDSTRSVETYMHSFGQTATLDAFIAKCRDQDRYNWDIRFTADKVNSWIKEGFYIKSENVQIPNEFKQVQ
jgi:hypothetical protein